MWWLILRDMEYHSPTKWCQRKLKPTSWKRRPHLPNTVNIMIAIDGLAIYAATESSAIIFPDISWDIKVYSWDNGPCVSMTPINAISVKIVVNLSGDTTCQSPKAYFNGLLICLTWWHKGFDAECCALRIYCFTVHRQTHVLSAVCGLLVFIRFFLLY